MVTNKKTKTYTITLTRSGPEWRWTMTASNSRIVGASTEGYKRRAAAIANIRTVTGFDFRIHMPWIRRTFTRKFTR